MATTVEKAKRSSGRPTMTPDQEKRVSKFLSLVLRHEPELIGIALGPGGWVPIDALLAGALKAGVSISPDDLDHIVAHNDKQRFSMEGGMIRANQGHSVEVDLQLEPTRPPEVLYHGTVGKNLDSIRKNGLERRQRQHVHLSPDVATATKVGARRGKPVVLTIASGKMHEDGHVFFLSTNSMWLTEHVPPQYVLRAVE
jgi:putative RNA 2'-phosphotransferase